jgi:hypothetical protein
MNGIDAKLAAHLQDLVAAQVAFTGLRAAHAHGLVGVAYVQGMAVGLTVDGYGLKAHFAGRAQYTQRNFAPIGDQQFFYLLHGGGLGNSSES